MQAVRFKIALTYGMMYRMDGLHRRSIMFGKPLYWVLALVVSILAWKFCPNSVVSNVGFIGTLLSIGGVLWTLVKKGCCGDNCDC